MSQLIESNARVSIDLDWHKLLELMKSGALCGTDIHTSDPGVKQMIQTACLKSCVQKMCAGCDMSDLCGRETCPSSRFGQATGKLVVASHSFSL